MECFESDKTVKWAGRNKAKRTLDCPFNGKALRGSAVFNLSSLNGAEDSLWHYQKKSHSTLKQIPHPNDIHMADVKRFWHCKWHLEPGHGHQNSLHHGNVLTEAVQQICNYIPVKTSSWILKSCWHHVNPSFWWKAIGYILWD